MKDGLKIGARAEHRFTVAERHTVRALFSAACEVAAAPDADRLCEYNVIAQVEALAGCQVVNDAWRRRQCLVIHGWVYVIEEGLLRPVCDAVNVPIP